MKMRFVAPRDGSCSLCSRGCRCTVQRAKATYTRADCFFFCEDTLLKTQTHEKHCQSDDPRTQSNLPVRAPNLACSAVPRVQRRSHQGTSKSPRARNRQHAHPPAWPRQDVRSKDWESFPRAPSSRDVNKIQQPHCCLQRSEVTPVSSHELSLFGLFVLLARVRTAPFVCAAMGCGKPSEEVAVRRVMSTANWFPWNIRSPDAISSLAGTTLLSLSFDSGSNDSASFATHSGQSAFWWHCSALQKL